MVNCSSSEELAVQRDLPQNSLEALRDLFSVRSPVPEDHEDFNMAPVLRAVSKVARLVNRDNRPKGQAKAEALSRAACQHGPAGSTVPLRLMEEGAGSCTCILTLYSVSLCRQSVSCLTLP